jgi:hypothetical protein
MVHILKICLLLALAPLSLFAQAPVKPQRLSGVVNLGYTNSRVSANFPGDNIFATHTPEFYWGVDLALRLSILDPRFISLSLEPSIMRANGSEDERDIHRGTTGGNFYLDFLQQTYYPFHFYFVDQNADYVQGHLSSTNSAHRSIGFDWTLRKPHLPPLMISYESGSTDYRLSDIPSSLSRAKRFSAVTHGTLDGWSSALAYSKQKATEAFTGTESSTDILQGNTRKEVFSRSALWASGLYQTLRFKGLQPLDQSLPFVHLNTNFNSRITDKLSSDIFYRFYWMGNVQVRGQAPVIGDGNVGGTTPESILGSNSYHAVGAGLNYQLLQGLTVGETTEANFTSFLNDGREFPTRAVNVAGNVNWSRRIRVLHTRAGYRRGVAYTSTNFGNSRAIWFDNVNAGVDIGDRRYLLLRGDYSLSRRPDLFEIGGRYSQQTLRGSFETSALRIFNLTASAGQNRTDFLSSRGRERFRTATYSLTLVNRRFTIQASQDSTAGLQNLLVSPLGFDPSRVFRTLPVETLLNAPLSATFVVYTTASAAVRLRERFDAQFRYLRQRIVFPFVPIELVNQYELYGTYRLGKFTFSAGVLVNKEDTQDLSQRNRRYYFVRMSRPFRIF